MINIELINDFSCSSFCLQQMHNTILFKDGNKVLGTAELIDGPTHRVQRILYLNIGPRDDIRTFTLQLRKYVPTLKIVINRNMTRYLKRKLHYRNTGRVQYD